MTNEFVIWLGIAVCVSQSAIFSGLNLALFSLSRLQLEVESKQGNESAKALLSMREDSNFLLCTLLWGNVAINVMLTLLSESVLTGLTSFFFSTFIITFLGEIFPQAYCSRNALKVAFKLSPFIKFYQVLLFPVAKATALMLDGWLGREGIAYLREKQLTAFIKAHLDSGQSGMEQVQGALNFMQIENITVIEEGEILDPKSIITLPHKLDLPILPEAGTQAFSDFVKAVNHSGQTWVLLQNNLNEPLLVLDADGFIRSTTLENTTPDPYSFCHRPIVINDPSTTLGDAIQKLKSAHAIEAASDSVLQKDVIIVWTELPARVITGSDILGRLLKGIG